LFGVAVQIARLTVALSRVTAPFLANTLHSTDAEVIKVALVKARIFPLKTEFAPRVAELPTYQNTLHACAPLVKRTMLEPAVVSVDEDLKIKTALGSPSASSVTVPVIPNVPAAESYTHAFLIVPPSSVGMVAVMISEAKLLYAVSRSFCACTAVAFAIKLTPFKTPGGNPVTEFPGLKPRFPVTIPGPVTVDPAIIAKPSAEDRLTGVGQAANAVFVKNDPRKRTVQSPFLPD